jgi:protein-tyrosine phosphatase
MNQIQPHRLWIGHAREERDFRALFGVGIRAFVDLALEDPPARPPRELITCRFPLLDGAGNDAGVLGLAIRTVAALARAQVPTVVCCGGGVSRSPAVAAAALSLAHGESPAECLERVVRHHPADVSPGLWNEVVALLPTLR